MSSYHVGHSIHAHNGSIVAFPARGDLGKKSSSKFTRDGSLPRIDVIPDEMNISDSPSEIEDGPDWSDYESEDDESTTPSIPRPPTPHADYSDAWSSRYSTPVSESRFPQPSVPFPRRVSIAGGQSFAFASVDRTQNNYRAARRFSAPHIKYVPPYQAPTIPPPPPKPKPPNTPLKLYPWMTKKECSPPRETTIKCPYPTNDCTDVLPSNIVLWRRHFSKKHGLARDKIPQECQWPGCGRWMGGRSLNRHVLTHHMDFKASCPYCKARRRDDHLEKHLSKCQLNPAREIGEE